MSPSPLRSSREAVLLLEDGTLFRGRAAASGTAVGEVVFNTAMTGYQEILTDPSYRRQIVVMTQPHIGNYGTREDAAEADRPWAEGFVARRFTGPASGTGQVAEGGSEEDILPYLKRHAVPALDGVDTRALVRRLREKGAMRGILSDRVDQLDALRAELDACPPMVGQALVDEVTGSTEREIPAVGEERCHIALYDFGAKANIVRELTARGARVTLLPARTPASRVRELGVGGVMLSNGPGDPEPLGSIIETVRELIDSGLPLFGICLGHQLLALALGGRTYKLKFGHHGGNQPVRDEVDGRVTITSQNHGFAVDPGSLPERCRVRHVNLNDGTVEGIELIDAPVFSVQYHPEAAPGPHDAAPLFDRFLASVLERAAA